MKCPVCAQAMVEQDFDGTHVDVCVNGCKGMWFDWAELSKLDETNEGLGQALQDALNFPRSNDANRAPINCPKCGVNLHAHKFKSDKQINIDECYCCGGIFLDSGELQHLRDNHMSEQEEIDYTSSLLTTIPAYKQIMDNEAKKEARTNAIKNFAHFVSINYFVPLK